MVEVLKDLTKEQIEFICKECKVSESELFAMDDDMLYTTLCVILSVLKHH